MKKIVILIIALLLTLGAAAQGRLGIEAGATFSTLKFDDNSSLGDKYNTKTGHLFGLTYDFDLIGPLGIHTALTYIRRNVEYDGSAGKATFHSSSLELPLNLKVTLPVPIVRPYLLLGPYLDYGLEKKQLDRQVKMNRFNYGITLGAGVNILGTLRVSYLYDLGLSELGTSANDAIFDSDAKNRSHRLSVGVMF